MGNVKPASIEALQSFLKALDRKSYTGMRDYAIIVLMLDTGIRTKELLICIIPILMQRRGALPYQGWLQRHGKPERFI